MKSILGNSIETECMAMTPLPFISFLGDLAETQTKLALCRTVVENSRKDVVMNLPYLCMKIVLYGSRLYVSLVNLQ